MVHLQPDISTEEILDMVADGTYSAAVANSQVARAALPCGPNSPSPSRWARASL